MAKKRQRTRTASSTSTSKVVQGSGVKKTKCNQFIYGRISSKKQQEQQGLARQKSACLALATGFRVQGKPLIKSEVISGSLSLDQRKVLKDLLSGSPKRVFVESARAISRNAMGKKHGVEFIPSDIPTLFTHHPKPGETFMRHVMLAVQELERDLIVERLLHGLEKAKASSTRVTQKGAPKVNGCKSIIEKKPPKGPALKSMRAAAMKHRSGHLSCRGLCDVFKKVLKRRTLAVMTALRMAEEIATKDSCCKSKVQGSGSKAKAKAKAKGPRPRSLAKCQG